MEISGFNLIILIVLLIVISIVLSMNILNIIDNKLRDISIKLPANHTQILIQTEDGRIQKINLMGQGPSPGQALDGSKIEPFTQNADTVRKNDLNTMMSPDGVNSITPIIIASDPNKPRIFLKQGYHTSPAEPNRINRSDKILYPDHDDILRYDGQGCYENRSNGEVRRVQLQLADEPIVQKCNNELNVARINTVRKQTLTADGTIVDQNINFYIPETYLGVTGQRGAMMSALLNEISNDGGEPADVDQIGSIPVNNYKGEPVPIGGFFS
jgi:hypothetical protein